VKNHAYREGNLSRTASCPFCGGEHRRKSKEQRECRRLHREGKPPAEAAPPKERAAARPGTPTTHYKPKPKSWTLSAQKMARNGWSAKRIAKRLGVSAGDVEQALRQ
jgi:hypothetical protein